MWLLIRGDVTFLPIKASSSKTITHTHIQCVSRVTEHYFLSPFITPMTGAPQVWFVSVGLRLAIIVKHVRIYIINKIKSISLKFDCGCGNWVREERQQHVHDCCYFLNLELCSAHSNTKRKLKPDDPLWHEGCPHQLSLPSPASLDGLTAVHHPRTAADWGTSKQMAKEAWYQTGTKTDRRQQERQHFSPQTTFAREINCLLINTW